MAATQDNEGQAIVADAPFSNLSTRRHQMFPELTDEHIDHVANAIGSFLATRVRKAA